MKIKQSPDDFIVEELTDVVPTDGPFALYRLEKSGWTTNDAVISIRRRWRIDSRRLSYGGLKDRHAHTFQHLTILHGPHRNLAQNGFSLTYLGQTSEPFTPTSIRANRFRITIRNLTAKQVETAGHAVEAVRRDGIANYFDDQRFGSVTAGSDFVARQLVLGNFEAALKLALAEPYEHDRSAAKREKAILHEHWGNWKLCKEKLPRGHAHILVDYLVSHPADFRGAFARLRQDLGSLYLSAYQSHLWNRLLAAWLGQHLSPNERVSLQLKMGSVPTPRGPSAERRAEWALLSLPLPSARLDYAESIPGTPPDWPIILKVILDEDQIELGQMKLKGLRRPFFSRGARPILFQPEELVMNSGQDERNAGRQAVQLAFVLPPGSYATLVVKRLFV
ncbi:MAG TPA: tRNA pseudouridine(13) synthase TruD [Gemmataceae bacterium]|jgi:tRNA pseudouridine13 synthase|nr:tRNA pseudouridine(13) synthase TruD [Gemmataceae bacterium]